MDLSFAEAMQTVESFHPERVISLFEGTALKGVVRMCVPDVCIHGDQFDMATPQVRIYSSGRAAAVYECGCVYLGHFDRPAVA